MIKYYNKAKYKLKNKLIVFFGDNSRQLLKASSLSFISTAVRIIIGFISNKFTSVFLGPSGIALLAQFGNFTNLVNSFSQGGINSGIVKYIAEFKDDEERKAEIIKTASFIVFVCSTILAIFVMFTSTFWADYLLKNSNYWKYFFVFGVFVITGSFYGLLGSILNGLKEIKKLVLLNILVSIVGLFLYIILIYFFNIEGAFLASTLLLPLSFILGFILIQKTGIKFKNFLPTYNKSILLKLSKFSAMTFTSALIIPVTQIFIRNIIIEKLSLESAGYWQGVVKLSDMYLMVITSSLVIYYIPRLSEIKDNSELRKEINLGFKIIVPVMLVFISTIYIFRDFIISIFYTNSFMPMRDLFVFQLTGDLFKIMSWLLATQMLAKAMAKMYIITEILFNASYVLLSVLFFNYYSIKGLTIAYALNYFLYLMLMVFIFRKVLFVRRLNEV